jgi:asparagine synthetase B (glutamine-hydrolysing)
MCGIAGFIDPSLSAEEGAAHLQPILDLIAHRGPDGAGTWEGAYPFCALWLYEVWHRKFVFR